MRCYRLALLDKFGRSRHNSHLYMQPFLLPNILAHRTAGVAAPIRR